MVGEKAENGRQEKEMGGRGMIEVKALVFSYEKGRKALKGLDFEVEKGEIFGFLGPNGSGKSTTQKILTGIQGGYQGEVRLMGKAPDKTDRKVFSCL